MVAYLGSRFASFMVGREEASIAGVDQIGEDLHDHVLIAGFGRVGQTVAKMLSAGGISYVALDLDTARIAACRTKGMPVFFGNASQVEILNSAGAGRARGAVITIGQAAMADRIVVAAHEYFPDLLIFVRARDLPHGRHLEKEGATQTIPETLEASLQLGAIAMSSMGASSDEVMGIKQALRNDDYANLGDTIHG